MCLKTVDFACLYDTHSHAHVGYGYKAMERKDVEKYLKWSEAKYSRDDKPRNKKTTSILSSDSKHYNPGFHIFLSRFDAENYICNGPYADRVIVRVKFKNVIAFGLNKIDYNGHSGKCIIATHMKVVEVLNGV